MITKELVDESLNIHRLVNCGDFDLAYQQSVVFLEKLEKITVKGENYFIVLGNVAGGLVDIGQMSNHKNAAEFGFKLMDDNKEALAHVQGESHFYYNYGNALFNKISDDNPHDHTFLSIEELVSLKNIYWRAFRFSSQESEEFQAELSVNLANSLRSQFRLSEALRYYDLTNRKGLDIPQSWVNRSAALIELNLVLSSYSIKQLKEIRKGYINASVSKKSLHNGNHSILDA